MTDTFISRCVVFFIFDTVTGRNPALVLLISMKNILFYHKVSCPYHPCMEYIPTCPLPYMDCLGCIPGSAGCFSRTAALIFISPACLASLKAAKVE